MADSQVEEVKAKTDIVSVIGEFVNLKKAGRNFKSPCPFHNEKSPSFVVSPELQMYKCFGCGVAGDVFTFLQEYEGLDFPEALNRLADAAGVVLVKKEFKKDTQREQYFKVNEVVRKLYNYLLTKHPVGKDALMYLREQRGITDATIETFTLGFSPEDTSIVINYLTHKKKIAPEMLETLGIIYRRGNQSIDRFRGRVIFPLCDHRGGVVGFAGRILPEFDTGKVGKYINSPETPLYHKSSLLYGMDITRADIKKTRTAIVVEGELDFLSVWQSGVKNVVAIKGSSLTEEQSQLIHRFADKVVLALDADSAGDAASRRGIAIAEKVGLEVSVCQMGTFKDPDEVIKEDPKLFVKMITEALPVWDFLIESTIRRNDVTTGAGQKRASEELVPILASIEDKIVQAHYVGIVAQRLQVPPEAVLQEVEKKNQNSAQIKAIRPENPRPTAPVDVGTLRERRLLSLGFNTDPASLLTSEITPLIADPLHKKVINAYLAYAANHSEFDLAQFSASLPEELHAGLGSLVLSDEHFDDSLEKSKREFELLVKTIKEATLKDQLSSLVAQMRNLEEQGDEKTLLEVKSTHKRLSDELSDLRKEGIR